MKFNRKTVGKMVLAGSFLLFAYVVYLTYFTPVSPSKTVHVDSMDVVTLAVFVLGYLLTVRGKRAVE